MPHIYVALGNTSLNRFSRPIAGFHMMKYKKQEEALVKSRNPLHEPTTSMRPCFWMWASDGFGMLTTTSVESSSNGDSMSM